MESHRTSPTPADVQATLHIYNLPLTVSEADVIELLSCVGPVRAEHIALRRSWGDTGFNAYVTMQDANTASEVVHRCDGRQFFGNTLKVKRVHHRTTPKGPHVLQ